MNPAGKRKIMAAKIGVLWLEPDPLPITPSEFIRGTIIIMMGAMKMPNISRRLVKARKSFLIIAASTDEKPILPNNPVFGK